MEKRGLIIIMQQLCLLLVALGTLRGVGILQTDIKQDNIMFVNVHDQPLGVKLIDFREAIPASNIKLVMELQPTGYSSGSQRDRKVSTKLPFHSYSYTVLCRSGYHRPHPDAQHNMAYSVYHLANIISQRAQTIFKKT
ncbi:hypothetical protein EXN66_Car007283 [Channa argus]|uniref:Protein kinase domain-containing protein n=1 Tax=Channa argus TaxID=215402 RepID=A0A6G1PNP2_CHAAH|nr:hypothetical protein EXN66_Car007283 [Channa argus]